MAPTRLRYRPIYVPFDSRYFFQRVSLLIQRYNSFLFRDEIDIQPFLVGFSFFSLYPRGSILLGVCIKKNNIYSFNLALIMDSFCFTDEDFVGSPGFFRSWRVETLRYPVLWMTPWSCFHIVQAMWCTIRVGSKSDDKSYSCGG